MWDRFDDAMDDIDDDISRFEARANELEKELEELGYTEFKRPGRSFEPKYNPDDYMNEAYTDSVGLWNEWKKYLVHLRAVKEKLTKQ